MVLYTIASHTSEARVILQVLRNKAGEQGDSQGARSRACTSWEASFRMLLPPMWKLLQPRTRYLLSPSI